MMIRNLIVFILIAVSAASCSTTSLTIDVLQPPQNKIITEVEEVALINRVDQERAETKLYVNGQFSEKLDGVNHGMQEAALYGLGTALNDYGYFNAGEGKGGKFKTNGWFDGPKLSGTEVRRLIALYEVDGIIALEGYEARIDASGEVTSASAVDRSYGTVYVPSFNGRQIVHMRLFFRFYDGLNRSILYEEEIEDDLSTSASGSTPDEVEERMPDRVGLLERLAIQLGSEVAQHISPYWKEEKRQLYLYGNNDLVRAGNLALKGFWQEASNIWFDMAENGKKSAAKKACYNMILASEVAGDLDLAEAWAERCIEECDHRKSKKYLERIQKRKEILSEYLD